MSVSFSRSCNSSVLYTQGILVARGIICNHVYGITIPERGCNGYSDVYRNSKCDVVCCGVAKDKSFNRKWQVSFQYISLYIHMSELFEKH